MVFYIRILNIKSKKRTMNINLIKNNKLYSTKEIIEGHPSQKQELNKFLEKVIKTKLVKIEIHKIIVPHTEYAYFREIIEKDLSNFKNSRNINKNKSNVIIRNFLF